MQYYSKLYVLNFEKESTDIAVDTILAAGHYQESSIRIKTALYWKRLLECILQSDIKSLFVGELEENAGHCKSIVIDNGH